MSANRKSVSSTGSSAAASRTDATQATSTRTAPRHAGSAGEIPPIGAPIEWTRILLFFAVATPFFVAAILYFN